MLIFFQILMRKFVTLKPVKLIFERKMKLYFTRKLVTDRNSWNWLSINKMKLYFWENLNNWITCEIECKFGEYVAARLYWSYCDFNTTVLEGILIGIKLLLARTIRQSIHRFIFCKKVDFSSYLLLSGFFTVSFHIQSIPNFWLNQNKFWPV